MTVPMQHTFRLSAVRVLSRLAPFAVCLIAGCATEPSQGTAVMTMPTSNMSAPIAAVSGAGSVAMATVAAASGAAAGAVGMVSAGAVAGGAGASASTSTSAGASASASASTSASAGAGGGGAAGAAAAAGAGAAGSGTAGPASFTRVWNEILSPKGCAGAYCHGGGQGNLKFSSKADAYKALVGVMAAGGPCGSSGKLRIKAGDPAGSLLLEKMEQTKPSCGDPMPIGTKVEPNCVSMSLPVCNTQAELALIKQWISAGAKDD